jgi:hypothetical protein
MPPTDATRYPQLYRAIKKKRFYDLITQTVLSGAFALNLDRETGVSLLKDVGCSADECHGGFNTCFGEFGVGLKDIRALGLEVMDDEPNAPTFDANHAEIIGIPLGEDEADTLARENLYSALADLATLYFDRYGRLGHPEP